jgi:hypothetical protein
VARYYGYYSTSQLQVFLKFLPGDGWAVGTSPIVNYDWKAEEWTVPLNFERHRNYRDCRIPAHADSITDGVLLPVH